MSKYKATFSIGRAGRVLPGDNIEDWERPRFGFYWWFWLPSLRSNGGKFKMGHCVDYNFHWFCFWCSLTFWPQGKCKGEKLFKPHEEEDK